MLYGTFALGDAAARGAGRDVLSSPFRASINAMREREREARGWWVGFSL